jgi:hypothetical protein
LNPNARRTVTKKNEVRRISAPAFLQAIWLSLEWSARWHVGGGECATGYVIERASIDLCVDDAPIATLR